MPAVGATVSPAWDRTGRFLGPSIERHWAAYPLAEQVGWWVGRRVRAGALADARVLGAAIVDVGRRRPVNSGAPGLLRARVAAGGATTGRCCTRPYTLWHLSYVVIGASLAAELHVVEPREAVARLLPGGGRRRTRSTSSTGGRSGRGSPGGSLVALAAVGLAGAIALGVHGVVRGLGLDAGVHRRWAPSSCSRTTSSCSAARSTRDLWFALAWGAFPVLTASFAQTGAVRPRRPWWRPPRAPLSAAQRVLSTPVRRLRRTASRRRGAT